MDPIVIAAVAELAKMGIMAYVSYMQQAGVSNEQIADVFDKAKAGLLARDPALLPSR
jgi:hypothetical protein